MYSYTQNIQTGWQCTFSQNSDIRSILVHKVRVVNNFESQFLIIEFLNLKNEEKKKPDQAKLSSTQIGWVFFWPCQEGTS